MKGIKINDKKIILELHIEELSAINNALSEICNKIEAWEFETRLGVDIESVKKMLEYLTSVYIDAELNDA